MALFSFGKEFEQYVLQNSVKYFKKTNANQNPELHLENQIPLVNRGLWWWNPPQDSIPVEFCNNTSVHGLSFVTKANLHLSERIFWTIGFILGVVAAVYLINDVWQRYYQNPVIVSFQPQEVDIDTIPFPSVTLCNMNAFPRSKVTQLKELASGSGAEASGAKELLKYVRYDAFDVFHIHTNDYLIEELFRKSICNSQQSFAETFDYANTRGVPDEEGTDDTISEDSQDEMIDFLLEHTMPCSSTIRLCTFGEKKLNCDEIFKPIITDYGKCCTFNILPLPLLLNNPQRTGTADPSTEFNPALGKKKRWTQSELDKWSIWNYDDTGFILYNDSITRPYRQKRAGLPYGLSLLIDPNLDDWYCPISDGEGFRFILHKPLEMPHVDEFASVIRLSKEVLVEIRPELTNADDDIRDFKREVRKCIFPKERQLKYFVPYTGSNCVDECTAIVLESRCNCTHFFMPRGDNVAICNTNPDSKDQKCIGEAKVDLLETLKVECEHCDSLCEDVEYNFEISMASLQPSKQLWNDPDLRQHNETPSWAHNKMSILHIFFGSETVVPKLRKRLYGTTDLIANTGGLLGLCLGFSVLSAVEVIYFLTIRAVWKYCWPRGRVIRHTPSSEFKPKHSTSKRETVISLRGSQVPVLHEPRW